MLGMDVPSSVVDYSIALLPIRDRSSSVDRMQGALTGLSVV